VVAVRGFLSFLFDTLCPRLCAHCGSEVVGGEASTGISLSGDWPQSTVAFFADDIGANALCSECWLGLEPSFWEAGSLRLARWDDAVSIVSPFFTNDVLLSLVRFLKFGGGTSVADPLSWWMARALESFMSCPRDRMLLVPVPLHWIRQRRRGYNQSSLLARGVARELGVGLEESAIERNRMTRRQANLDEQGRCTNVQKAFFSLHRESIRGADVVLVDDLITSGETARRCLEALMADGPQSLTILAAGRRRGPRDP
jgi:ComF family protein